MLGYLTGTARDDLLEELERGHVVTAFAASERAAGSDFGALAVSAEPNDIGYTLNGRKEYSSNLRQARYVIVVARTSPGAMGGLSWFLVPMDAKGLEVGPRWDTLGLRAIDVSPLDSTPCRSRSTAVLERKVAGCSCSTSILHSRVPA